MQAEEGATPSVALRCFPPSDAAFRTSAEQAVASFGPAQLASSQGPALLEDALRGEYPQVVVRPRTDLAALDLRPATVWYVYRDGKVVPDEADEGPSRSG